MAIADPDVAHDDPYPVRPMSPLHPRDITRAEIAAAASYLAKRATEAVDALAAMTKRVERAEQEAQGWCRDAKTCASACDAQKARAEKAEELADKYKWQVRDTCARAEAAEARFAALQARPASGVTEDAVEQAWAAIAGDDVAAGLDCMSVVRGDIRVALESFKDNRLIELEAALAYQAELTEQGFEERDTANRGLTEVTQKLREAALAVQPTAPAPASWPTVLEGASTLDGRNALTVLWPDGEETVELVSDRLEVVLALFPAPREAPPVQATDEAGLVERLRTFSAKGWSHISAVIADRELLPLLREAADALPASLAREAAKDARIAELEAGLEGLVRDVNDYPAWQRPCLALDRARTLLNGRPA